MRLIPAAEIQRSLHPYEEIAQTLREDGIVCFPSLSTYRLAANALSEEAVIKFLQIKRRTNKAPVLIFVPHKKALHQLVASIPQGAHQLIDTFWPGSLTLLFDFHPEFPRKIKRNINGNGKIGIRKPKCEIARQIVEHFDGPLIISSANLSRKSGARSEAQIRKNFARWIDIFVSSGDLREGESSTILDVTNDPPLLTRSGTVSMEEILKVWNHSAEHTPELLAAAF